MANPDRGSTAIMAGIHAKPGSLPSTLRRILMVNRGAELATFRKLRAEFEMISYFCDPKAPWQKVVSNASMPGYGDACRRI
jgi:IS30 family transposase